MREVLVKGEEFKDSPVGKIPKDWEVCCIGDLGTWRGGSTPSKSLASNWNDGEILWVTPKDFRGTQITDCEDKITKQALANNNITLFEPGNVLVVFRSSILRHTFPVAIGLIAFTVNQDIKVLSARDGVNQRFALFLLQFLGFEILRAAAKAGTTVESIDYSTFSNLLIYLPPVKEQQRIVEILDTVDDAIAHTSSLITKLKQIKAGLLHDLLTRGLDENGQLRDPEAHPEEFKDSPLGRIPKKWEVHPLQNFTLSSAFGPRFSANAYDEKGNIATLRTTDMDDEGNLKLSTMPLAKLSLDNYSLHFLEVGDLLVSRSGTCGITSVFPGFDIPVLPGAFLIRFRLKNGLLAEFVRRYFNWDIGRERVLREAEGGVQKNLRGSTLLKLLIPVPPEIEQTEILRMLDAKELYIRKEEAYLNKLKLQKQGLMHDLLTGKVRVNTIK